MALILILSQLSLKNEIFCNLFFDYNFAFISQSKNTIRLYSSGWIFSNCWSSRRYFHLNPAIRKLWFVFQETLWDFRLIYLGNSPQILPFGLEPLLNYLWICLWNCIYQFVKLCTNLFLFLPSTCWRFADFWRCWVP